MQNEGIKYCNLLLAFIVLGLIAGCNAKPYDYQPTAGEMKQGPGLFSGKEGAFTLYDSKGDGLIKPKSEKTALPATTDAVASGSEPGVNPEEAEEFQNFQEWKKEKKEFEDFRDWKKSAEGTSEYQEFLEWKQWKSYQEWKKGRKTEAPE